MKNEAQLNDRDESSADAESIPDALGETHLGKNLAALLKEIGSEEKSFQPQEHSSEGAEVELEDSDPFEAIEFPLIDPDEEDEARPETSELPALDETLEAAEPTPAPVVESPAPVAETFEMTGEAAPSESPAPTKSDISPAISQVLSTIEGVLQEFAQAERRKREQELEEWKAKFKQASMQVIKKQVESARARWVDNTEKNEKRIAEQFNKLKVLANKVAKQKVEIQKAKKELESKLEVADRLHTEFDQIRDVLGGQIGALDALESSEDQAES